MGKLKKWFEEGEFFTYNYIRGDNSKEGFTKVHRTVEERTNREVDGSIKLSGIKSGDKVLDLPCGYGRHSIEFAKRDFSVTAMDLSSSFLNIAKSKAKEQNLKITFIQKDMRQLPKELLESFDAVVNLSYSFGFFESEEDNVRTMLNFYNALKKGGKLILHTDIAPEMINKGYLMKEIRNLKDLFLNQNKYRSTKLEINEEFDETNKRIIGTWTIIEENLKRITLPKYSVRIYSQEEFFELCKKVGFSKVEFIGDWNEKFDPNKHQELIVVATK